MTSTTRRMSISHLMTLINPPHFSRPQKARGRQDRDYHSASYTHWKQFNLLPSTLKEFDG